MRSVMLAPVLCMAVLMPRIGRAQVSLTPAPPPPTTAATAAWQLSGEPVFHAGAYYYPTGPSVFFDGNVMSRVDTYRGVPIYTDATLTPYSVVYVPIGGKLMRPYERRRDGELAGTVANRTPSFPVQIDSEPSVAVPTTGIITPAPDGLPPVEAPEPAAVPTIGELAASVNRGASRRPPVQSAGTAIARGNATAASTPRSPVRIKSAEAAREPATMNGVWVPYDGARWYSDGPAVTYAPDRFTQVGEYHGFPVYRAKNAVAGDIYIPSSDGGPVAPYKRR